MSELPDDIARVLAGERAVGPSPGDAAMMKSRIAASVAALAIPSTAAAAGKVVSAKLIGLIVGAAVIGGAVVWGVTRPEPPAPVRAPAPVPSPTPARVAITPSPEQVEVPAPPVEAPLPPPPPVARPAPRIVMPPSSTPPPPPPSVTAESEAELIAAATRALRRGDGELALVSVTAHASRFPRGELAEERDAIRIEALLALHRLPEARAAAHAFTTSYSHSVHQRLIERTMKETSP